jgi:hypothetical protein
MENPHTWTGLMAGFAPAPTDRSTTNSGDTGGPSELPQPELQPEAIDG